MSVKSDVNNFLDDRYGFITTSRIWLQNAYLGQFGGVLGILTPKIVKFLFWPPKVCSFREDTRFEILRVKIGSAVSSVAFFKY